MENRGFLCDCNSIKKLQLVKINSAVNKADILCMGKLDGVKSDKCLG